MKLGGGTCGQGGCLSVKLQVEKELRDGSDFAFSCNLMMLIHVGSSHENFVVFDSERSRDKSQFPSSTTVQPRGKFFGCIHPFVRSQNLTAIYRLGDSFCRRRALLQGKCHALALLFTSTKIQVSKLVFSLTTPSPMRTPPDTISRASHCVLLICLLICPSISPIDRCVAM